MTENKILRGQFFTTSNPFDTSVFYKWFDKVPDKQHILEPFAGSNNILNMVNDLYKPEEITWDWSSFDIEPPEDNNFPDSPVLERDSFKNFPTGYQVAITNPPYLAKNSAKRRGLDYPQTAYDDVYKYALAKMLDNCDYVGAIIPESFINSKLFQDRLYSITSLTCKMFDDTNCPVALALFVPTADKKSEFTDDKDYYLYNRDLFVGNYRDIEKQTAFTFDEMQEVKFNVHGGELGIKCIDNTKTRDIHFLEGKDIPESRIKVSSRAMTKVSLVNPHPELTVLISECNRVLTNYRDVSNDVFLTPFKGLRADNYYRRRLDFKTAKNIISQAVYNLKEGE